MVSWCRPDPLTQPLLGLSEGLTTSPTHDSRPMEKLHPDQTLLGPIRAVDVLDILAYEDNRSRADAMHWGTKGTAAYYRAWLWLTAVVLQNPRPELDQSALWALQRVQGVGMAPLQHRLEAGR